MYIKQLLVSKLWAYIFITAIIPSHGLICPDTLVSEHNKVYIHINTIVSSDFCRLSNFLPAICYVGFNSFTILTRGITIFSCCSRANLPSSSYIRLLRSLQSASFHPILHASKTILESEHIMEVNPGRFNQKIQHVIVERESQS